ncbi:MAG: hypothetical protein NVSMB39_3360 [Candidatus Saccharimonadales bacterium]
MSSFDINSNFISHILLIIKGIQEHGLVALFDLLLGILVIRILVRGIRLILKATHIQTGMRYVITSISESFLWILLTFTLLQELGLTSIIYFFTGSIAAIGIAMAAGGSTLISDIVAAIFLARDGDFNVGDEVIAGDPPVQGVIERMDSRRTRLRDKEGALHIMPNSTVERKEWVVVYKRTEIGAISRVAKRLSAAALEKRTKNNKKKHPDSNNQ